MTVSVEKFSLLTATNNVVALLIDFKSTKNVVYIEVWDVFYFLFVTLPRLFVILLLVILGFVFRLVTD